MIIKSIELENIRSYKKCKINFLNGINFLSGDIGSGKSTILLAIEFGLLGFKRGDLEGIHLLRKGENQSSIKLILDNNSKEIEIFRKLKKSKSQTITQENGYIKIDSNLLELSPNELNSHIFEILNFPKEFISKDKNLIYRFTIYTPQEQLKEILFSSIDKRLEIIRKIFAIDKYKNLKDAILIYNQKIREDKKFLEAKLDVDENLDDKIKKLNDKILNLKEKLEKEKSKENPFKETEKKYQNFILKFDELKEKIQNKIILIEKNLSKIEELEFQNKKLKIEEENKKSLILDFKKNDFNFSILDIENKIKNFQEKILEINYKFKLYKKDEINVNNFKEKILKFEFEIKLIDENLKNNEKELNSTLYLDNCPTCFQKVSKEHKEKLKLEKNKNKNKKLKEKEKLENEILIFKRKIDEIIVNSNSFEDLFEELNFKEKIYMGKISKLKLKKEKLSNLEFKKKSLDEEILNVKNKIRINNEYIYKKENLIEKNLLLKEKNLLLKEKIKKVNNLQFDLNINLRKISNNIIEIKTNIFSFQKELKIYEGEILNYKENKIKYENLIEMENFLSKKIVNIAQDIETYVFTKYYSEFNLEFENFFKDLIEDNEIDVRLSSDFSPIIEQNGYDIDISNLSGGEKSSLAISYRFGLKKIIENNLESSQKLSLLILDEPTDGFSSVQVDRLGQILKNLNLKQIILVSHDTRIDSISDNIINIEKENHISKILHN